MILNKLIDFDLLDAKPFSLFISDLHLCESRPAITQQFITFLQSTAKQAQNLYILGDLFEYWAGDDDMSDGHRILVISALKALSITGTHIYFMHGNRDFLISDAFAKASGVALLTDPVIINLYDKRILLSHGDALCTDDTDYQTFRLQVRNHHWQSAFTSQPLSTRKAYIESLRLRSEQEKSQKSMQIMDVNTEAVEALFRQYDYPELMIHGHTHRPNVHQYTIDHHVCTRWVLGDWYEQGSYLKLDANGCLSQPL